MWFWALLLFYRYSIKMVSVGHRLSIILTVMREIYVYVIIVIHAHFYPLKIGLINITPRS